MDETRRIEIVQKQDMAVIDTLALAVSLLLTYYVLDPEAFQRHKAFISATWQKAQHRVSIWQARRDIESLPETDDNQ